MSQKRAFERTRNNQLTNQLHSAPAEYANIPPFQQFSVPPAKNAALPKQDTVRDMYSNSMADKLHAYGTATTNKLSPSSLKTTSRNDYEEDCNSKV